MHALYQLGESNELAIHDNNATPVTTAEPIIANHVVLELKRPFNAVHIKPPKYTFS